MRRKWALVRHRCPCLMLGPARCVETWVGGGTWGRLRAATLLSVLGGAVSESYHSKLRTVPMETRTSAPLFPLQPAGCLASGPQSLCRVAPHTGKWERLFGQWVPADGFTASHQQRCCMGDQGSGIFFSRLGCVLGTSSFPLSLLVRFCWAPVANSLTTVTSLSCPPGFLNFNVGSHVVN